MRSVGNEILLTRFSIFVLFSGSEARRSEVKIEPTFGNMGSSLYFKNQFAQSQNGPKIGFVSVALTLTPTAAEVRQCYKYIFDLIFFIFPVFCLNGKLYTGSKVKILPQHPIHP